jgi:ligand-binding sensor domain-containing protein
MVWSEDGIDSYKLTDIFPSENITANQFFNDKENNLWILGKSKLFKIIQNNPFSKLEEEYIEVFNGMKGEILVKSNELTFLNTKNEETKINIPKNEFPITRIHASEFENSWIISINDNIYRWQVNTENVFTIRKNTNYIPFSTLSKDTLLAYNRRGDIFYVNSEILPIRKIDNINSSKKLEVLQGKFLAVNNQNIASTFKNSTQIIQNIKLPDSIYLENLISGFDGLWYYNDEKIFRINSAGEFKPLSFGTNQSLKNDPILNIFDDQEGNLWVSTKNNLLRIPISIN